MNGFVLKYFLDKNGIATKRIAGKPGAGHIDIASTVERLERGSDIYEQMFAKGYVRVAETDNEVLVDAPAQLTINRGAFLKEKERQGKSVIVNDCTFVESRNQATTLVAAPTSLRH